MNLPSQISLFHLKFIYFVVHLVYLNFIPFKFLRRQFSLVASFKNVGIYLSSSEFSHGQIYVAISSVTTRDELKILITGEDSDNTTMTFNVVYHVVFPNV